MRLIQKTTIIVFFLIVSGCLVLGQTDKDNAADVGPHPVISESTYLRVLERIFPETLPIDLKTDWTLVFRFRPYGAAESQLVVQKFADYVEVREYQSRNGVVFLQLNRLLADSGSDDPDRLARAISVSVKSHRVSKALANTILGEFERQSVTTRPIIARRATEYDRTGSWTLPIHSGYYDAWLTFSGGRVSYSIQDFDQPTLPFTKWLKALQERLNGSFGSK